MACEMNVTKFGQEKEKFESFLFQRMFGRKTHITVERLGMYFCKSYKKYCFNSYKKKIYKSRIMGLIFP